MQLNFIRRRLALRAALILVCLVSATCAVKGASATPTQIPAGSTAALGTVKAPSANTPQSKILQHALNHETRQTLQQAMDSMDVSPAAH